eukprot:9082809-Heterocapsa_arctica.AAC.1
MEKGFSQEAYALQAKMGNCGAEAIREQEMSWDTKKKDIYRWIRGKTGQAQLLVHPGGSAQMSDRLKVAEEAWGGLWVVDAEDLSRFEDEEM